MANIQKYLDQALQVLDKYGVIPKEGESKLVSLLTEVAPVDEPKVLAIAKTVKYMHTFNEMVRENVEAVHFSDRYNKVTGLFNSIRDDSKKLIKQLDDGKIDRKEKMENLWMKLIRGTPHKRFDKITGLYDSVSKDTKVQLDKELAIMDGYLDFRTAIKESEILSHEVKKKQGGIRAWAEDAFKKAIAAVNDYKGADDAEKARLELARDEAKRAFDTEDRKYQLIKDVAENLTIGYNVGETLVAKLKQTHDLKDQVYRKAITFFTTNEHVFTTMDAVYTSQHGLHEQTQTLESMKQGANKGLEDVAELGNKLEKEALKAGYGSTLNPASVQKLVDAVVNYQIESVALIKQLRVESDKNAKEIAAIVEDGKKRFQDAVFKYEQN
ncbi:MAG TPA: cell surface protein [Candidatus Nanoarchaeia archaeon]|nr:cell surface protein [Candidatus Nanoarchaeia archaeon]